VTKVETGIEIAATTETGGGRKLVVLFITSVPNKTGACSREEGFDFLQTRVTPSALTGKRTLASTTMTCFTLMAFRAIRTQEQSDLQVTVPSRNTFGTSDSSFEMESSVLSAILEMIRTGLLPRVPSIIGEREARVPQNDPFRIVLRKLRLGVGFLE
jgi:hypothetical protein